MGIHRLGLDDITAASQMCSCVVGGDLLMLKRLLKAGAPPDATTYKKSSPLHLSAAEGNLNAVSQPSFWLDVPGSKSQVLW